MSNEETRTGAAPPHDAPGAPPPHDAPEGALALEPDWPAPPRVRACVTLRAGGTSPPPYSSLNLATHVGDDPAHVSENRRRLAARLALPAEPCWLDQVHGTNVLDFDAVPGRGKAADAAVTGRPGVVCAVLTADCVPVLLANRSGRRVGAAHAGWRGLAAGVLGAAVAALGSAPEQTVAWLGPAIGKAAFEVGDEVRAAFAARGFAIEQSFALNARGRWQADLHALAAEALHRAGVAAVFGGGFCTYSDSERFFSHRREAPCGRFASLIWLED